MHIPEHAGDVAPAEYNTYRHRRRKCCVGAIGSSTSSATCAPTYQGRSRRRPQDTAHRQHQQCYTALLRRGLKWSTSHRRSLRRQDTHRMGTTVPLHCTDLIAATYHHQHHHQSHHVHWVHAASIGSNGNRLVSCASGTWGAWHGRGRRRANRAVAARCRGAAATARRRRQPRCAAVRVNWAQARAHGSRGARCGAVAAQGTRGARGRASERKATRRAHVSAQRGVEAKSRAKGARGALLAHSRTVCASNGTEHARVSSYHRNAPSRCASHGPARHTQSLLLPNPPMSE